MRFHFFAIIALAAAALVLNGAKGFAQINSTAPIRTNFFRGPALSAQEMETVIELARQCGMDQAASIADVMILPETKSVPRSLTVTSTEHVEGRKISYSFVLVGCTNWIPVGPGAKRLGKFYVNPPYLHTGEFSLVRFGTNVLRLKVSKDIPLDLADTIMSRFAKRDVRLSISDLKSDWARVDASHPVALSRDPATGNFCVSFGDPIIRQQIPFRYIGNQVIITYIPGEIVY